MRAARCGPLFALLLWNVGAEEPVDDALGPGAADGAAAGGGAADDQSPEHQFIDAKSEERLRNITEHMLAAAEGRLPEGEHFNPLHGIEDLGLHVGMPGDRKHISAHGWDFSKATVAPRPAPPGPPPTPEQRAAHRERAGEKRKAEQKRENALMLLRKFLNDLAEYRKAENEGLVPPLGPLHRGELSSDEPEDEPPESGEATGPLAEAAAAAAQGDLSAFWEAQERAASSAFLQEQEQEASNSVSAMVPDASGGWGQSFDLAAKEEPKSRQGRRKYGPAKLRPRTSQGLQPEAPPEAPTAGAEASAQGVSRCDEVLAAACARLANGQPAASLLQVGDGGHGNAGGAGIDDVGTADLAAAAAAAAAEVAMGSMGPPVEGDAGDPLGGHEGATDASPSSLLETEAEAAVEEPACVLPQKPRRDFELVGCTVDGCRDHATLQRATAACASLGSGCGGVTRTPAGQYHTRAAHRGTSASPGSAMWEQSCTDRAAPPASAPAASKNAASALASSDPCGRYKSLVGEARWAATKEALLRLLQKQGTCSYAPTTPKDASAAARAGVLAAGGSVRAGAGAMGGNINLAAPATTMSYSDTREARSKIQQYTNVYYTPPEPRRLTEGDGSFVPGKPLEMWESIRHYRRRISDIGEIRETPWRNTLNCTCKQRPPGTCNCFQYAECVSKTDKVTQLKTLGKQGNLELYEDYGTFINHEFEERVYSFGNPIHEQTPQPVVYSLLQEGESSGVAASGSGANWSEGSASGADASGAKNLTRLQAERLANKTRRANLTVSERQVAQQLSDSMQAQLERELMEAPFVRRDEPSCEPGSTCPAMLQTQTELNPADDNVPKAPVQGTSKGMYSQYSEFEPHSRETFDCVVSDLKCNCSHTCECEGSVPDKKPWWHCWTAFQNIPWPWPTRIRCEDEGLQTACGRDATCNAYGRMDNLAQLEKELGAPMKRKCLDLCRCTVITCWGLLWF